MEAILTAKTENTPKHRAAPAFWANHRVEAALSGELTLNAIHPYRQSKMRFIKAKQKTKKQFWVSLSWLDTQLLMLYK